MGDIGSSQDPSTTTNNTRLNQTNQVNDSYNSTVNRVWNVSDSGNSSVSVDYGSGGLDSGGSGNFNWLAILGIAALFSLVLIAKVLKK